MPVGQPGNTYSPRTPWRGLVVLALGLAIGSASASAQNASLEDLLGAVVQVKTFINPDGRTVENLGQSREGSGVVIDDNGLILTIGYLMVEAHAAEIRTASGKTVPADIVGYEFRFRLRVLRAIEPLKIKPMPIGIGRRKGTRASPDCELPRADVRAACQCDFNSRVCG